MSKKTNRRGRFWLLALGGLAILAVLAVLLLPQLLVRQATQKPAESQTGTFVTRQVETSSLQDKMQQAIQQGDGNPAVRQDAPASQSGQARQDEIQLNQTQTQPRNQPPAQPENPSGAQALPQNNKSAEQPDQSTPSENPDNSQQSLPDTQAANQAPIAEQAPTQPATPQDKRFRVQMSESEIAGMIYSGLNQGTAPEYRASIEGVSTRIQNGRARITVALKPQHLPEAFLKNLPGVTRSTPTVYLGGEMSLRRDGNSVDPQIHELSLGNFRVPMPFIREAVRATVQQQADQLLRLPNGQQARLDEIQLENGALVLYGHVD